MLCIDNANRPTSKWWLAVSIVCTLGTQLMRSRPYAWYKSTSEALYMWIMLCTGTNGKKYYRNMCNERKILMVRLRSELCHCFDSSDRECIDWISDCCFSPVRWRLGKSDLALFYSLFGKKSKRKKKQNKNASAKKRRTTDCWMPLNKYKNTNSLFTCSFVFNELNFCAILNVFPGFQWLFDGRWQFDFVWLWTKNNITNSSASYAGPSAERCFNFSEPFETI